MGKDKPRKVFLIKTSDRDSGISKLMEQFNLNDFYDDKVALKANYNSADPFPASTHIDTLETIIKKLKDANVADITLAERSGMGNTRKVLETMGVLKLSNDLGFNVIVLDDESKKTGLKSIEMKLTGLKVFTYINFSLIQKELFKHAVSRPIDLEAILHYL